MINVIQDALLVRRCPARCADLGSGPILIYIDLLRPHGRNTAACVQVLPIF